MGAKPFPAGMGTPLPTPGTTAPHPEGGTGLPPHPAVLREEGGSWGAPRSAGTTFGERTE